jgi:hypothetical protein
LVNNVRYLYGVLIDWIKSVSRGVDANIFFTRGWTNRIPPYLSDYVGHIHYVHLLALRKESHAFSSQTKARALFTTMVGTLNPRYRKTRYVLGLVVLISLLLSHHYFSNQGTYDTPTTVEPQFVPNRPVLHEIPGVHLPVTQVSENHISETLSTATAPPVPSTPVHASQAPNLPTEVSHNAPVDDTQWILSSWMDYPNPLTFRGSPSLLTPSNSKPLNVLLINDHWGVENEVHAMFDKVLTPLGMTANFTHVSEIGKPFDYTITDEMGRKFFFEHRDYCDSSLYDLIVVGDVITFSRPFLHAGCKTNILLYVTQRFDFGVWGNKEYNEAFLAASKWPNVRVMINNVWEKEYARKYRNTDFHVFAYAPSSGILTSAAQNILGESRVDWTNIGVDEFTIVDRPNQRILLDMCRNLDTKCPTVISSWHGGPLGLAGRIHVHVPYQVNTMSLFENLNNGVIYVLPSARLYRTWVELGLFLIDGAGEHGKLWTEGELSTLVDWWRSDLQPFFFYFDDVHDLAPGSAFRQKVLKEAGAKRERIKKFMEHHQNRTVDAWRQVLASFYRLPFSKPMPRLPQDVELPPVAKLPPPALDKQLDWAL